MTVQDVRAFNRFYTNLIGALDYSRHLYTPYTLTEARILYELAHADRVDAADLRTSLHLDAGHLSRLLLKFEKDGLLTREPSARDARRQRITLTDRGHVAAALLEERSLESVGAMLEPVPEPDRDRLAAAMRTIRGILADTGGPTGAPAAGRVRLRPPEPGDLGWIVQRHGELYSREYGWNGDFEALVARIVGEFAAEHDPHKERVWIAELDGVRAGCVMCVADAAPGTARLRLLLVEPSARGHGIGDRLVRACLDFAREAGYRETVLWTNSVLDAARHLYRRAGFTLTGEKRHHSYGKELVGQDWHLVL
ncbi:GNAT family N-acetyltransferase [Streptomyces sp. TR06-5]|uniref:bifunctional helix-turn-helix transcriptional regulator/GNAT family N-acetyltransferase n=1 Tax=unclassified Streptomyces TaxID=2593676 RepID=UPI0039A1692E